MSTINLKLEPEEDGEVIEYKIEIAEEDASQPEGSDTNTADCGRIILNLEKNSWSFSCFFCEIAFNDVSDFIRHITDSHIELLPSETDDEWETGSNGTANLEITPIDHVSEEDKVDESFYEPEAYNKVAKLAVKCTEESSESPSNNPHKCEFCEKTFRYKSKLRDHLTIHTGELLYKCDQCPKAFRTNDILRFHLRVHKGESFQCHHCDQVFSQKRYLHMHLKYHLGEQTFPCTICGKTHRTSGQLKVHMTKHTLKKDNICEICGACYRLRQHLVVHLKQKHENKREFQCDQCDKAFNTKAFLNHHKLSHLKQRIHICSVCGMGFIWRKNLLEHIKLHSGIKNHKCEICGKAFAQKSGLLSHVKIHA